MHEIFIKLILMKRFKLGLLSDILYRIILVIKYNAGMQMIILIYYKWNLVNIFWTMRIIVIVFNEINFLINFMNDTSYDIIIAKLIGFYCIVQICLILTPNSRIRTYHITTMILLIIIKSILLLHYSLFISHSNGYPIVILRNLVYLKRK